jgi:hypothetical protein
MRRLKCIKGRRTATGNAILETGSTRNRDENDPENKPMILADYTMPLRELAAEDGLDVRQACAQRLCLVLEP